MKNLRLLALCGLTQFAVFAHATYDLILAVDAANDRIDRIDGTTGASLGSFGTGFFTDPSAVVANPATGRAYVYDAFREEISVFNYSTGVFLQSVSTVPYRTGAGPYGTLSLGKNNEVLFANYFGAGRRFSADLGLLGTYDLPSGQIGTSGASLAGDGFVYSSVYASRQILKYNYAGGAHVAASVAVPGGSILRDLDFQGVNGIVVDNAGQVYRIITGAVPSTSLIVDLSSTMTEVWGARFGHGNLAYVSGIRKSDSKKIIRKLNFNNGSSYGDIELSGTIRGIEVIAAPEPGSMIALGLGTVALLRRRKSAV